MNKDLIIPKYGMGAVRWGYSNCKKPVMSFLIQRGRCTYKDTDQPENQENMS